jgi:hypothetical protein
MPKFDPENPIHVRAKEAIQGYLWTLHEAGLEVVDAIQYEYQRQQLAAMEAHNELDHQQQEKLKQEVSFWQDLAIQRIVEIHELHLENTKFKNQNREWGRELMDYKAREILFWLLPIPKPPNPLDLLADWVMSRIKWPSQEEKKDNV